MVRAPSPVTASTRVPPAPRWNAFGCSPSSRCHGMLADPHARLVDGVVGDPVVHDRGGEAGQGVERVLGGERVDDVAHRVGRGQAGVVAAVDGLEVAAQRDVDGQVAQRVALAPADDLDDADLRLAVLVGAEHQLPR